MYYAQFAEFLAGRYIPTEDSQFLLLHFVRLTIAASYFEHLGGRNEKRQSLKEEKAKMMQSLERYLQNRTSECEINVISELKEIANDVIQGEQKLNQDIKNEMMKNVKNYYSSLKPIISEQDIEYEYGKLSRVYRQQIYMQDHIEEIGNRQIKIQECQKNIQKMDEKKKRAANFITL